MARTLDIAQYTPRMVSAEEFYILCESIVSDCNTLDASIQEITRLQDNSDALEDIIVTGDRIDVVTPTHAIMLDASLRTAVAGSDVSIEELMPNIKQYIGMRFDMQGISDHVMNVWRYILQKLEEAWKIIYDFGYKYLGTIPRLRSSLQKLKKKLNDGNINTLNWPSTFNVGIELYALSRNDKIPTKPRDILEGIENLRLQSTHYLGVYFENYVSIYEELNEFLTDLDNGDYSSKLNAMTDKVLTLTTTALPTDSEAEKVTDKRFGNDYQSLPALPNNKTIFIRTTSLPAKNEAVLRAEAAQAMVPLVRDSKAVLKRSSMSYELGTLSPSDMAQILDACLEMLDATEKVLQGEWFDKLKNAKRELQTTSDALVRSISSMENNNLAIPYIRSAVKYNTMMTAIYSQLITSLTTLVLVSSRSVNAICEKNLRL
jgi:hypothetical protein